MYQRVGGKAYKANLDNTLRLAAYLGNPERKFKSVHVAGTNGKGSTSHMIASVLQEAGYRTGLYTSPHLKDFRERIRINGEKVSEEYVVDFVKAHKGFFENNQLSFFEMTVGLAFDYFASEKVDIVVIEVGLGGRLDSTNIVNPEVSVITNIGFDHMDFLGETLSEIASEKAGIIKKKVPAVIGERQEETTPVFEQVSLDREAPLIFAEDLDIPELETDLLGSYQLKNSRTAAAALHILRQKGWRISDYHIKRGLVHVVRNTSLMGRWQQLSARPRVICDTAHNKEGLSIVMEQLTGEIFDKLHLVIGVVADKRLDRILPLFPKNAAYYFCKPDIPRGLDSGTLAAQAANYGLNGEIYSSVPAALQEAMNRAGERDLVFVGGSTFTVAEVV